MATMTQSELLSDELLQRCWERSAVYDADNRFFDEDFKELNDAGYLKMAIPSELGGLGYTYAEVMQETRNLAYYAHATAVGLNMHNYWVGICADMWRSGDKSAEWLLKEAAAGKVFAAGHAESGNDMPVLASTTSATKVDGGYKFKGRKSFGSLTPVWDYLGLHAMDTSDPEAPMVVHAFMPRDTPGYSIVDTWDTLGMRATTSQDTVLDDVFVPDDLITRVVPVGAGGVDQFVLGIFIWALGGFGNVYYGLARRAKDLAIENVQGKTSIAMTRPLAHHPEIQRHIANMVLELEAIGPQLDKFAEDWTNGVDYGMEWVIKVTAAKFNAVEGAFRVADTALEVAGGYGIFRRSNLERLFRDARLGRIHPANAQTAREFIAKITLGLNPDDQPRWG